MHQKILPGALRPAESTVETQGSTVESGGDGGPTIRMRDVGPPPRPLPVTEEDTPPTTPASYRVPPRARYLPRAFVRSGPQEDWVPKRGSYHSTTATSVRGNHGQTTRRAPPEAPDGPKTSRGGKIQARGARSRIGWTVSRTTSKRSEPQTALRWTTGSHSELTEPYGPLRQSRMDPCGEDGRWSAVAQGGVEGSGKVHDLLAQRRSGGQSTTCDQTRLS